MFVSSFIYNWIRGPPCRVFWGTKYEKSTNLIPVHHKIKHPNSSPLTIDGWKMRMAMDGLFSGFRGVYILRFRTWKQHQPPSPNTTTPNPFEVIERRFFYHLFFGSYALCAFRQRGEEPRSSDSQLCEWNSTESLCYTLNLLDRPWFMIDLLSLNKQCVFMPIDFGNHS